MRLSFYSTETIINMKKLALIICLFVTLSSFAQTDTGKMQVNNYWYGFKYPRVYTPFQLAPPQDTVFSKWGLAQIGSALYAGNGTYWTAAGSSYNAGFGINLNTSTFAADTFNISSRLWRQKGFDSLAALSTLQWITDRGATTTNKITGLWFEATDENSAGTSMAGFRVNRLIPNGIADNGRGFTDQTLFSRNGWAYASYDANARMYSTVGANYDHYVAFQARMQASTTGTITNIYGLYTGFSSSSSGTVTNVYNTYYDDYTGGTVTNQVGHYVASLTKGGTLNAAYLSDVASGTGRYAFYGRGTAQSYLGGTLTTAGIDNYNTNIRGSFTSLSKMDVGYFDSLAVKLTGNQTIAGNKHFSALITTVATNLGIKGVSGNGLQIGAVGSGGGGGFYTSVVDNSGATELARFISSGSYYNTTLKVGGTSAAVASAQLEVTSTTKGFLPPRMTAAQASAISSPAEGLLVYVTDTSVTFTAKGWWGWNGAAWEKLNN
jgi:hypothetical protein